MDLKTMGLAIFIAAAYVAWPNLAKPLGIKPGFVMFAVIAVALVVVVIIAPKDITEFTAISTKALVVVIAVSIANGLAIYLYGETAADKNIPTGIFLVMVFILQMCFATLADWLATGAVPTLRQAGGLGLAASAMWLLAKTT